MKIIIVLFFFLLSACGDAKDTRSNNMVGTTAVIGIQLSEAMTKVLSESPVEFRKECLSQVNMCWYKISRSASDADLPAVLVNKSLKIEHVTDVKMSIDGDVGDDIENLELMIRGLPDNSRHEENQALLYSLIKEIKASGWKHYFAPYDPRISGSQAEKIVNPGNVFGVYVKSHPWFDPDFKMNMGQWLKVDDFYDWNFYSDGNYLTLKAWRRNSDSDPTERGTYLISLKFMTEREYWVSEFSKESDKARWTELLPDLLLKYKKQRDELEAKARDAGIDVDSSYKEPSIKALN